VLLNGAVVGEGSGRSKKEAEQISAKAALEKLSAAE
jgi:ribonuclease-3